LGFSAEAVGIPTPAARELAPAVGVKLSWNPNIPADQVAQYRVFRTPTSWMDCHPVVTAGPESVTAFDLSHTLLPGTSWYYLIVAVNAHGISEPTTCPLTIPVPPAP
jgi:hypothetical protein